MEGTANFDGVRSGADEEESVVADAKPEFFSSLERFYVAFAGIREAGIDLSKGQRRKRYSRPATVVPEENQPADKAQEHS
jgi:hypothetical protein